MMVNVIIDTVPVLYNVGTAIPYYCSICSLQCVDTGVDLKECSYIVACVGLWSSQAHMDSNFTPTKV